MQADAWRGGGKGAPRPTVIRGINEVQIAWRAFRLSRLKAAHE